MLKKVHIPRRHQDTFGAREAAHARQKDVILHSERYQVNIGQQIKMVS